MSVSQAAQVLPSPVPIAGISQRTGRNVPRIAPTVDTAYTLPETRPASAASVIERRMAKGETQASKVMGTTKRMSTDMNEPAMMAASKACTATAACRSTGLATSGTNPAVNAPQAMIR